MSDMSTILLLEEYEAALKSDDPRDINRFLWQHCQDFIEAVKRQRFVIGLLNDIIDEKDLQIENLEARLSELDETLPVWDEYGE